MDNFKVVPQLSFSEALKEAKGKLTQFTGRSRRSEFWWCFLVVLLLDLFLSCIPYLGNLISFLLFLAVMPLTFRRLHDAGHSGWWCGIGVIGTIVGYAVIILSLGLDFIKEFASNPEAGMELGSVDIAYVPMSISMLVGFVYNVIMVIFMCEDSQKGTNKYGDSPKYVAENQTTTVAQEREWA